MASLLEATEMLLENTCAALDCGRTPATADLLGFFWCEDCSHRRYLLQWGKTHRWPTLAHSGYAIAEGVEFYGTTALLGDDERVCALLAATEEWDAREV